MYCLATIASSFDGFYDCRPTIGSARDRASVGQDRNAIESPMQQPNSTMAGRTRKLLGPILLGGRDHRA